MDRLVAQAEDDGSTLLLPLHSEVVEHAATVSSTAARQRKGGRSATSSSSPATNVPFEYDKGKSRTTASSTWNWSNVLQLPPNWKARLHWRQLCRRQTLIGVFQWAQQYPKRALAVVAVFAVILRPSITWKWYTSNFGRHYLQGGYIGKRILEDGSMRQALERKLAREAQEMRDLGATDWVPPPLQEHPFRVLNLRFDTAYRTLVLQREKRAKALYTLEQRAESGLMDTLTAPPYLFVPQTIGWVPPRPRTVPHLQRITFDDQERRQALVDSCPSLDAIYQHADANDKVHVWAICMMYYYGGYFLGDRIQSVMSRSIDALEELNKKSSFASVFISGERINGLVATPRHPVLKCVVDHIATLQRFSLSNALFLLGDVPSDATSFSCKVNSDDCCQSMKMAKGQVQNNDEAVATLSLTQESISPIDLSSYRSRSVSISKLQFDDSTSTKYPIESQLRERRIQPSWSCMRCLMMPMFGRMSKCSRFCDLAYFDFMCNPMDEEVYQEIPVTVTGNDNPGLMQIPKIIHQTWFEEVSLDRYPQLARLQNSWKEAGWEYRLYTDDSARSYILDNFSPTFAEAFDVLKPGAFRADFFRYLALMKEGGVYADVDVLLETNLDHLVRPGLSFFVPRDVVAEYADEAYCLWNGLIGAVPGHPIIVRAVERSLNHILERADIHDIERAICRRDKDTDLWKIHTQPLLLLTGPCALGISLNEAMGRPSLHAIDIGWTSLEVPSQSDVRRDVGDALILVLDKYDLGGFRFSDPYRNIIIASTNFEGLEKSARNVANPSAAEKKRQQERKVEVQEHYSKATKGSFVWGSEGIYRNKLISKFRIKFKVNHVS